MQDAQPGFTVREAARQIGRSQATVRGWIELGKLRTVASSGELRVDRAQVLAARARHLADFDDVTDAALDVGAGPSHKRSDDEASRLRFILRAVLSSIDSFDEGLNHLRRSQRVLLDTLLQGMSDTADPEAAMGARTGNEH